MMSPQTVRGLKKCRSDSVPCIPHYSPCFTTNYSSAMYPYFSSGSTTTTANVLQVAVRTGPLCNASVIVTCRTCVVFRCRADTRCHLQYLIARCGSRFAWRVNSFVTLYVCGDKKISHRNYITEIPVYRKTFESFTLDRY